MPLTRGGWVLPDAFCCALWNAMEVVVPSLEGAEGRLREAGKGRARGWVRAPLNRSALHPAWAEVQWEDVLSGGFTRREHINLLEAEALSKMVRTLVKDPRCHGHDMLCLCDSQVVVAVLAKGRSSSMALLRKVRRINALLLATRVELQLRWVPSEQNPSDGASRRHRGRRLAP